MNIINPTKTKLNFKLRSLLTSACMSFANVAFSILYSKASDIVCLKRMAKETIS